MSFGFRQLGGTRFAKNSYVPFESDYGERLRRRNGTASGAPYNDDMVVSYSKNRGVYQYHMRPPDHDTVRRPVGKHLRKVYLPDIPVPVHLNPYLDKGAKVHHLKKKLLTGHHVTHSQINIVAYGNREQRKKNKDKETIVHMTDSAILHAPPLPLTKEVLYVDKGIVGIPTPHSPGPLSNSFGTPNELRVSLNGVDTQETHQRYRFFVDMGGFKDEEIEFELQGRKLLISGDRPKSKQHNAKSVSEIIHLPQDLPADNLRAVRDCFGTIILEEAWKF